MLESTLIALMVYLLGSIISFLVAFMIKAIFWCIKYNENMKTRKHTSFRGPTLTSKPVGH